MNPKNSSAVVTSYLTKGQPMGNFDMMIAAHALASGLILATSDRAFNRIKKLKIEDWTKA